MWALIVSPFALAGALLWLRERQWRRSPVSADRLTQHLADRGFLMQAPTRAGVETTERYLRDSASATSATPVTAAEVLLSNAGGQTLQIEIAVGAERTRFYLATRAELADLLVAHPEVLEGDFTAIRNMVESSRPGRRAPR